MSGDRAPRAFGAGRTPLAALGAAAALAAAAWPIGTPGAAWWSAERFEARSLARLAAERLAGEGRVFLATRVRHLGAFSARHAVQVIARGRRASEEEALVLVAEPRR